jgi:hypothetical protein
VAGHLDLELIVEVPLVRSERQLAQSPRERVGVRASWSGRSGSDSAVRYLPSKSSGPPSRGS